MREVDGKKEYKDEVTGEWVSKNELKKRNTQRKKEKDAADKAAKKAATQTAEKSKKKEENEEDLDPSKYTENRKNYLESVRQEGKNPYPHKFKRDMTVPEFRKKFEEEKIENGSFLED